MEPFIFYFLKSSGILIAFYVCYLFLLRKETLFQLNRYFLLLGIVLSISLPFVYFSQDVVITEVSFTNSAESIPEKKLASSPDTEWLLDGIMVIYLLGTLYLGFKFILQFRRLKQFLSLNNGPNPSKKNHIISDKNIQPFSFFHWIIYNPKMHSPTALEAIIAHEEVHVRQRHSLDILLVELFCILQWFNPIVWYYRTAIKQNLEFLADAHNNHIKTNKKEYQYVLLHQSISEHQFAIVNPFFNSLIKKRIVMINSNPSHQLNALKSLLVLPVLAFFLLSFNVKKNYIFKDTPLEREVSKRLEFIIDKNTTDADLLQMKSDLAKAQFDFSYTTVRNQEGEIQNLSIEISGGNTSKGEVSSRYNSASDNDTISPTYIVIDTAINKISIGNGPEETTGNQINLVTIDKGEPNSSQKIVIREVGDKKQVAVDSRIISKNDTVNYKSKNSIIIVEHQNENNADTTIPSNSKKHVVIRSGGEEDADVTIIEKEGDGFLFTDTENDKEPLFYVDGKKSDSEAIKNLNPNKIKSMNVLKGVSATKKYGETAKNGVIEIITKQ